MRWRAIDLIEISVFQIQISAFHLEISQFQLQILFVLGVLRPSQPNGVMSSAVSLPNHTFAGQA